ncbi:MAG: RagB/SusD family nutrient uptake outer membrane protein [Bacteroidales bacterium]|nr:RagB/SusD family nutrient uptake outer membrane protein [Bacteroidales bacterium]
MKKILIIFSVITFGLAACEDQLDQAPISDLSVAGFFRNESDFEQAVNGVYHSLRGVPSRWMNLSDIRSDNFYAYSSMGVREWDPVTAFAKTLATSIYMDEAWSANFEGIMRANTLIENLSTDAVPDDDLRNRFEAEAKFLRGFFYFELVKWFGKVPLIDHLVTPTEALDIPRSPVTDIYNLIISDLQFAIENLDDYYPKGNSNMGRATKNAARGILARVYLARSGPDYGIEGPGLGANEYGLALSLLNDIIASKHYDKLENYADIFSDANENNEEVIFDIQFESNQGGTGTDFPGEFAGRAWWNSVAIPWDIALETKDVSEDMINSYDTIDKRFDVNIQLDIPDLASGDTIYDPTCIKYCSSDPQYWGVDRFDFPINFIVLRYTDVLMMKAECILNGASGTQGEVNQIVNDVRDRAGLNPLPGDITLDDLMAERRKEFFGEGLRWHDLVRSGKVLDMINAWIPVEDIREMLRENYPIQAYNIIYPLPQEQIDVKKGLYEQNLGYE